VTVVVVRGMPSLLNGRRVAVAGGEALITMGRERRTATYPDDVVRAVVLEYRRARRRRRAARRRLHGWS
jgi:hypothetical protein